jgi:hypothetical protein
MAIDLRELSPRARAIGVTVWASFLAACVGTMFFFAFIAPDELVEDQGGSNMLDRLGVYTLGFFGLWLLAALASALALYLNRTTHERPDDRSH